MGRRRSLAGKTILLTGAAGGIGSLVAERLFVRESASLLLLDMDAEGLAELAARLERARAATRAGPESVGEPSIRTFEVDLSDAQAIAEFTESIASQPLDGLVNNAGIIHTGAFATTSLERFQMLMDVNFMAAVRLCRLLLPALTSARGSIVNVASGAGLVAPAGLLAYAASKFALVGFSEALRAELRGSVAVSTICPAFVATSIVRNSIAAEAPGAHDRREGLQRLDALVKRIGIPPHRVADAIVTALKTGSASVPMGAMTHFFWNAKKVAPNLVGYLNSLQFRKLMERLP